MPRCILADMKYWIPVEYGDVTETSSQLDWMIFLVVHVDYDVIAKVNDVQLMLFLVHVGYVIIPEVYHDYRR